MIIAFQCIVYICYPTLWMIKLSSVSPPTKSNQSNPSSVNSIVINIQSGIIKLHYSTKKEKHRNDQSLSPNVTVLIILYNICIY